jgi:hypothetical protein
VSFRGVPAVPEAPGGQALIEIVTRAERRQAPRSAYRTWRSVNEQGTVEYLKVFDWRTRSESDK